MKLKDARRAAGLTQAGLSREARVGVATVRNIEQGGSRSPRFDTVHNICRVVGVRPEDVDEFAVALGALPTRKGEQT